MFHLKKSKEQDAQVGRVLKLDGHDGVTHVELMHDRQITPVYNQVGMEASIFGASVQPTPLKRVLPWPKSC